MIAGMHADTAYSFLNRLCRGALELLAPPRCRVCGRPLWGHGAPFLCPACIGQMQWIGPGACRKCGHPAGQFAAWGPNGCTRCRDRHLGLAGVAAVARYRGGARNLVKSLKFRDERVLAPVMGALMAERWLAAGMEPDGKGVDLVVPISLHPRRRRSRGFDQAALLAETVAGTLGRELAGGALRRVRPTKPQALLRRSERLLTMRGVFEAGAAVRSRTVLLVDDVFTTGSTMSAAAAACRKAGAAKVYGLAFAR